MNGLGAHSGLRHGDGGPGAAGAERVSGRRKSDPEGKWKGRLKLSDPERATLGEIGHRLGRQVLGEVANVARPETILAWHYHAERNHQGRGNVLLFARDTGIRRAQPVRCRERLGGLLRYYHQEAA